ncbi:hypothetical protein T484DRAFT_1851563, partial [Baffinella frigidus]
INEAHPEALILPVISTSLIFFNIHISFAADGMLKRAVQMLPILTLGMTYTLPQGLFIYWISTFGFTTLQLLMQQSRWWSQNVSRKVFEEGARIHAGSQAAAQAEERPLARFAPQGGAKGNAEMEGVGEEQKAAAETQAAHASSWSGWR